MSVPIFFLHNFAQKEDGERLDFPDILLENDFKRLYLQINQGEHGMSSLSYPYL